MSLLVIARLSVALSPTCSCESNSGSDGKVERPMEEERLGVTTSMLSRRSPRQPETRLGYPKLPIIRLCHSVDFLLLSTPGECIIRENDASDEA